MVILPYFVITGVAHAYSHMAPKKYAYRPSERQIKDMSSDSGCSKSEVEMASEYGPQERYIQ